MSMSDCTRDSKKYIDLRTTPADAKELSLPSWKLPRHVKSNFTLSLTAKQIVFSFKKSKTMQDVYSLTRKTMMTVTFVFFSF